MFSVSRYRRGDDPCQGRSDICGLRYNQITLPGTHNSGSWDLKLRDNSTVLKCVFENHNLTVTGQLDFGIRFFDFDLCLVTEDEATETVPAGLWSCHSVAYSETISMILTRIDTWLKNINNRDQIVSIFFNDDYDQSRSVPIAEKLHKLLEDLWGSTSNNAVMMNTALNQTGEWPRLYQALYSTAGRVFVFMHESLQLNGKPWIHDPVPNTGPSEVVKDNCNNLIEYTRGACDVCTDLFSVDSLGSRGNCILETAELCNEVTYNVTKACYDLRREYGKTVNVIEVDFEDQVPEGFSVVQVADMLNDLNVAYYAGSPETPPNATDCNPGFTPTPSPSPKPEPKTYCEALEQLSEMPLLYFQCQPNKACDRLLCPTNLFSNGSLFQMEFAVVGICKELFRFQVVMKDPFGNNVGFAETNETGLFFVLGIPLLITVNQMKDALGVEVSQYSVTIDS